MADVVQEEQEPCALTLKPAVLPQCNERLAVLSEQGIAKLLSQGFERSQISVITYLNLRYQGTDTAIMTSLNEGNVSRNDGDYTSAFVNRYKREYGFTLDRPILIDDLRVRVIGRSRLLPHGIGHPEQQPASSDSGSSDSRRRVRTYFENGFQEIPSLTLKDLFHGQKIRGPALVVNETCTILVSQFFCACARFCCSPLVISKDRATLHCASVWRRGSENRRGRVGVEQRQNRHENESRAVGCFRSPIHEHSRTNGKDASTHSHLYEHQGATGFLVCAVWVKRFCVGWFGLV